jgi:hypothetical protein
MVGKDNYRVLAVLKTPHSSMVKKIPLTHIAANHSKNPVNTGVSKFRLLFCVLQISVSVRAGV